MNKKEDAPLAELAASLRFLWRHRAGLNIMGRQFDRVKLGKKEFYLDHQIPGQVLDTFDNLNYTVKDGRKPVLVAKRKTPYGWHLVFNLPPGISFSKVRRHREYFQDACNAWITLSWDGKLHMDIHTGALPENVSYAWNPAPYSRMDLPIPIGVSQCGIEVLDLARAPHMLIGGVTSYGKSNFIHQLIASLLMLDFVQVAIVDCKRLDFKYLDGICALARRGKEAVSLLKALNKEMDRRFDALEKAEVVKVQQYEGDLPFIVLIVDELTEISGNDEVMNLLDRVVRLGRATGISIVAATQRPSVKAIPGDTRANFSARLMFQAASEIDSRIVLGEDCSLAARLPCIPGRAIYRYGLNEKEVQVMYLPHDEAKAMARQIKDKGRGWNYEPERKGLPPR